jgi:tetratricopeptide (TPR) repeat protein
MNEEGRSYRDEPALLDLIRRFEDMVKRGEQSFFDVDELEVVIEHYMEFRETRKAKAALQYAAQLYPNHLNLKLRHAQILANNGQPVKSVPILRDLLAIEPHNEEVHLTLGSVYSHMTEHRLAIQHYEQALLFADTDTRRDIRIDIALEFENLGSWKEAIRNLKEALAEDPLNETAVYELAFCFERTRQFKHAAAFYEQYLNEQPYSFAAWYSLGNALQQCGLYTKAIDAYDYAIAIEDAFSPAYHQKAEALVSMERYADALETYHETLKFEDVSPATQCYMGECLERLGRLDEASEYYKASLVLDPAFPDAFIGLGVLADLRGNLQEACAQFERAIALEPMHADYYLLLATANKKLSNHELAETLYARGLALEPTHEELWFERVDNMQVWFKHEEALALAEKALSHIVDAVPIMYRQFISQYALGQFAQAFDFLEHLLTHHFDGATDLLNLIPALANDARFVDRFDRYKP